GADQFIVQHRISAAQHTKSFQGQQLRITRTCTHQINFPFHDTTLLWRPPAVPVRLLKLCSLASWWRRDLRLRGEIGLARICRRASPNCSTQGSYPGPNCSSSSFRSRCASDGLCPPVEIAI